MYLSRGACGQCNALTLISTPGRDLLINYLLYMGWILWGIREVGKPPLMSSNSIIWSQGRIANSVQRPHNILISAMQSRDLNSDSSKPGEDLSSRNSVYKDVWGELRLHPDRVVDEHNRVGSSVVKDRTKKHVHESCFMRF